MASSASVLWKTSRRRVETSARSRRTSPIMAPTSAPGSWTGDSNSRASASIRFLPRSGDTQPWQRCGHGSSGGLRAPRECGRKPVLTAAPANRERSAGRVPMALVGAAFLLSGAAALVYQVVWQRLLALHTGVGITSIALIVAAFMAGLGFGSQAGGVLSARVSPGDRAPPLRRPRARGGSARRVQLLLLLRLARAPRDLPLHVDHGDGRGALPRPPRAHGSHGHVAAVPGAGDGRGRGGGLANHRHPLRSERPGGEPGSAPRSLGAHPLLRDGGSGPVGSGGEPARRGDGAPRGSPRVGLGARGTRGGARGFPSRRTVARALDGALRPLRLLRALPGDSLVPRDRRVAQEHRLHVRDRALPLPPRAGRGQPRGGKDLEPLRGPPARLPGRAVPAAPVLGARRRPPRVAAAGHTPLPLVLRLLEERRLLPARSGLERGLAPAPLPPASRFPVRPAHRAHGDLVRRSPARGAGRPAHERPQGGTPPGREHRGLRRGQPLRGSPLPRPLRDDGNPARAAPRRSRVRGGEAPGGWA